MIKKRMIIFAAVLSALMNMSCEEDFSPKAEFKEKYVLWCIVNASYMYGNSTQLAVLAKTYNVEGLDPYKNRIDPVLTDADIRLYADEVEYKFVQDTTNRSDTTRYDSTFIYYRSVPVKLRYGSKLSITAKLPGGEVLSSETRLPLNTGLEFSEAFDQGFSTINRSPGSEWNVWWETNGDHLFFPTLAIIYTIKEGEVISTKFQNVPLRYIDNDPYFPDYSMEPAVSYSFDAIDSAMTMLSAGDTMKQNYTIKNFVFSLLEYDTPLSFYYSSINGYLDNYSIRLDESTYSNITGGLGIFGSTLSISRTFTVSEQYAQTFGYNILK